MPSTNNDRLPIERAQTVEELKRLLAQMEDKLLRGGYPAQTGG